MKFVHISSRAHKTNFQGKTALTWCIYLRLIVKKRSEAQSSRVQVSNSLLLCISDSKMTVLE